MQNDQMRTAEKAEEKKGTEALVLELPADTRIDQDTVVLVDSDVVGKGENEMGRILTRRFLNAFARTSRFPKAMLFMNTAVHLLLRSDESAKAINTLIEKGVQIYAESASIEFYRLNLSDIQGDPINVNQAVEVMMSASRVITL